MRRYSMPEREARAKLRSRNDRDWHQSHVLCGYMLLIAVFVAGIFFFKHKHREEVEENWQSATAIIEKVQPKPVARVNGPQGGAMLYELEILVKYDLDGIEHKRWIKLDEPPELIADAELQAFRWNGKECLIRWKSSNPDQVIAEVS